MDKLIIIQIYSLPQQAHMAKSVLENSDIPVFLKDELTVQVHNFYSNAIGGIKLQVPQSRAKEAYKILEEGNLLSEKIEEEEIAIIDNKTDTCPFCKSKEISVQKHSTFLEKIILGFFSIFNSNLRTYKCNSCNKKWKIKQQ